MDRALEKAKKAVAECNAKSDASYAKTIRALLSAVVDCRQYVKENAQIDRGCAQRIARDVDQLLDRLPGTRRLPGEKEPVHNRRLAEAHLDKIQEHLTVKLKELEQAKLKLVGDWVNTHPVLSELKRVTSEPLPKGAYALLFCQADGDELELVTQSSADGRIFTRFRPQEFREDAKLHKMFKGKKPLAGAAVISEKVFLTAIGRLPQPEEGHDLLHHVLALSSQVASTPAREFLDNHVVLKGLHELASKHKLPKESYVLLFQQTEPESDLEVVLKTTGDGRTVTRFWPNEFSDKYKLFDSFRDKTAVVGAAVVQKGKLLLMIGQLPEPGEGQTQLQVVLDLSRKVMDKPMIDFLSDNEVLKSLYELANDASVPKDVHVLLFTQVEGGRLEVMSFRQSGFPQARIPLSDFGTMKAVHEKFLKAPTVAGASVIGSEHAPAKKDAGTAVGKGREGDSFARRRAGPAAAGQPVVLAAYGRTPLKAGHLATAETFRRLGIAL